MASATSLMRQSVANYDVGLAANWRIRAVVFQRDSATRSCQFEAGHAVSETRQARARLFIFSSNFSRACLDGVAATTKSAYFSGSSCAYFGISVERKFYLGGDPRPWEKVSGGCRYSEPLLHSCPHSALTVSPYWFSPYCQKMSSNSVQAPSHHSSNIPSGLRASSRQSHDCYGST
jgi:hypothetical protein